MIQLNTKTGYSFFYSALKCNDLVNISLESKSSYVAINDIRNMFGYLELEKLASKHHLTPLYLVRELANLKVDKFYGSLYLL